MAALRPPGNPPLLSFGNKGGLIRIYQEAPQAKARRSASDGTSRGITMSFHILFGAMCAVVTAYVAIAIIAIAKAYRDDRRPGLGR
jgi:hypothetical protein